MEENRIIKFDKARFEILTENLIRIEYSETGDFEDNKTQIVQNREFSPVKFDIIKKENSIEILTDAVHLYYTGGTFTKGSLYADVRFAFSVYSNRWYFGEKIDGNLGGTTRTLDTIDGECQLEDGIMSKNGFAILTDNSWEMNDKGDVKNYHRSDIDIYFFAYGRNYRQALKDYYHLTGNTPQLPRFVLGNWWSRYYEYSQESYLALMDKFQDKKVPLSVSVIDMDWHKVAEVPTKYGSGWTGYSWNKKLFPHPKEFIQQLHDKKLKVTLNDHPADGIRAFEDDYPKVAEHLHLNKELEEPAKFDFNNPDFRKSYFEDVHGSLEKDGVDFWWLDWQQGAVSSTGVDPLWLLNHYQYKDAQKLSQNNIILSRYAGPGSHRYPLGFSGDTVISWDSLDFQPYFTSTASNIGYTWWSHDIGGHMHGGKDAELSLRWLEYGVFSPINRLHSSKSEFTSKEPWHFDKVVEEAMEKFLRLRHSLIPYLYTANIETATKGKALVEPMYYAYPLQEEAYNHKNQYLFGGGMLVAPITHKINPELQMGEVDVWLPEGTWYDFFTGEKYEGDTELKIYREIDEIPVFVKAGAIIPLDKNPMLREEIPLEMIWKIFPQGEGHYCLVEDNNETTVTFDKGILNLTEKNPTSRKHTIIYAGHEITTLSGDFSLDLTSYIQEFDWDFQKNLFRRLDIAELPYDEKDTIYQKLSNISDFNKKVAYIKQLNNIELQDSLFEILYSSR
ncbi:TIM-barrel domain-containing protein [Lactococcus nasutitermitis]|uniref:TIM-barrel domain-containing protein n=1 Tax=Lactococcus nasutitermitis TaxID=1652957 RepID=A0ABV9JAQ3_9LACT|nr:TIM-barrel domain-containing protein [Lactococcus nasutitermitis]